ncbi:MAG: amidohydrolase family protein [Woeseia sp.]
MQTLKRVLGIAALFFTTAQAADTAFINVNVVPMTEEVVHVSQTVVVSDGRITAIGDVDVTEIPDGAAVVDGTDRYVMPGLAEMHAHVPAADSPDLERVLNLFIANGVTQVRGMLGEPGHLELREKLAAGDLTGPALYTSGPSFNGRSVSDPKQAAAMVHEQHAAGYDFLKVHPGLTRAEFTAMAVAANDLGIRFAGHVPDDVGVPLALELGISTIDHLDGYMPELIAARQDPTGGVGGFFGVSLAGIADPGRIPAIADATLEAGTWNVPTQSLFVQVVDRTSAGVAANRPEMKYMPEATVGRWIDAQREISADLDPGVASRAIELRKKLILELQQRGAGLLLGSDAPQIFNVPGFSIHHELRYLVDAGLSPYEALLSGTVNTARWFGTEPDSGTVEVGKRADLVVLDDNPLADIGNSRRVHGVMLRGRWLGRPELDALLRRYERAASPASSR